MTVEDDKHFDAMERMITWRMVAWLWVFIAGSLIGVAVHDYFN